MAIGVRMMRLLPKTSAQERAKIIAYVDYLIWALLYGIALFKMVSKLIKVYVVESDNLNKDTSSNGTFEGCSKGFSLEHFLEVSILTILFGAWQFYLNYLIFRGSKDRDCHKINLWFKMTSAISIMYFLAYVMSIVIFGVMTPLMICELIFLAYRFATLWFVHGFLMELRSEQHSPGGVLSNGNEEETSTTKTDV